MLRGQIRCAGWLPQVDVEVLHETLLSSCTIYLDEMKDK